MRGLVSAIRTLTLLPAPGKDSEDLSESLPWFPAVGLLVGAGLWCLAEGWSRVPCGEWTAGGAMLLLVSDVLLTRGLHLDGLADWADARGGSREREGRLSIMKDSRIGAFGSIALLLVVLGKWVAFERMFLYGSFLGLIPAQIIPRAMMVELMCTMPYARQEAGTAQPFVAGASSGRRLWTLLIALFFCLCFGPGAGALFAVGWVITRILAGSFKRNFGGVTGDLLGAAHEMVETMLLILCALGADAFPFNLGWWRFRG
ncbi:MAG: adenosylcobinamide-GDP ribazoletransferase [Deltaproteobacteria bacterium]|nr:adenosylcobinamide-GDP ribazoletransferase [Deltaproteobacteria bacterium]